MFEKHGLLLFFIAHAIEIIFFYCFYLRIYNNNTNKKNKEKERERARLKEKNIYEFNLFTYITVLFFSFIKLRLRISLSNFYWIEENKIKKKMSEALKSNRANLDYLQQQQQASNGANIARNRSNYEFKTPVNDRYIHI